MQTTDKPLVRIDGADEAPAKPGTDGRRTLEPRVEALRELGVPDDLLGSLVVRTPRLLHSPIEAIRAKVRWLYETSVLSSDDAPGVGGLGGFLRLQPDYLSFSTREASFSTSARTSSRRAARTSAAAS